MKDLEWNIKKNNVQIDKLENTIERETASRDKTVNQIRDLLNNIENMGTQRVNENEDFLNRKNEDAAAISLLTQARDALTAYYENNAIDMGPIQGNVNLIQAKKQGPDFAVDEHDAPGMSMSHKGKHADASKGIVQIMTYLIEDLNDEIMNGMKLEAKGQMNFDKANSTATTLLENLGEKKTNLEGSMADHEEDETDEELVRKTNTHMLKDEKTYKASIKPDCDWIIGAFTERADKRAMEMNGLVTAKEFLAGKKPSFLQKRTFNDDAFGNIGFLGVSA